MINGLYIIKDKLSGVAMDKPQAIINDACAVYGFNEFLKSDKVVRKECYQLIRIGFYNDETFDVSGGVCVVCNGCDAEKVLNELIANKIGDEDLVLRDDEGDED